MKFLDMIDLQKIRLQTSDQKLIEFAEFVLSDFKGEEFVNYHELDLMKVPKLVPNCFTFDYRNGIQDGLLMHHTGTFIDSFFSQNLTGKYAEDFYSVSDDKDLLLDMYRQAYKKKECGYASRNIEFHVNYDKYLHAESMVFQCSSDGNTLDFGTGIVSYTKKIDSDKDRYTLIH